MTRLDRMIRSALAWWRQTHPDRTLERAIPGYARAAEAERRAKDSGCTRALHAARINKRSALHGALRGVVPRGTAECGLDWTGRAGREG